MKILILCSFVLLAFGCTTNSDYTLQKKRNEVDFKQEQAERVLDSTPDWYISPPHDTEDLFYVATHAEGNRLSSAMDKARLKGEFLLTKQIESDLVAAEKLFSNNEKDIYQLAVETLVANVRLRAYRVVKKNVFAKDGKYQVFLLLEQSKSPEEFSEQGKLAFKDLRERIALSKE